MPLEQELKVVQDYMYLQQMRFGQRIRYDTDCNRIPWRCWCPPSPCSLWWKMPLSTVFPKGQGGRIHVRSWMEGRRLWISVADTGRGMARERLEEIRLALAGRRRPPAWAWANIYRRVHGMYQDGEVFIYSSEGRGRSCRWPFYTPMTGRKDEAYVSCIAGG